MGKIMEIARRFVAKRNCSQYEINELKEIREEGPDLNSFNSYQGDGDPAPNPEPSKPAKSISEGFEGAAPGLFQNIEAPSDTSQKGLDSHEGDDAAPSITGKSPDTELPKPNRFLSEKLEATRDSFASWLTNSCVGLSRTSTAAQALYRDYSTGAGEAGMDYPSFVAELERRGYRLHDGMITGLMLMADFIPLVQAEQVKEPAAIKEHDDNSNQKPRFCLGSCRRLMVHHWVDGQWICEQWGAPSLLRIYAKYRPIGRSIL